MVAYIFIILHNVKNGVIIIWREDDEKL